MPLSTQSSPGVHNSWATAVMNRDGIHHRVVDDLAPLLLDDASQDSSLARGTALRSLLSFSPETDADWFNASDIISFSLISIDLLKDARTLDMPPAMKLRFVGRAIQASRTAQQADAALRRRRKERDAADPNRLDRIANLDPVPPSEQPVPEQVAAALRQAFAEMAEELQTLSQETATAAEDVPAEAPATEPHPVQPTFLSARQPAGVEPLYPAQTQYPRRPLPVAATAEATGQTTLEAIAPCDRAANAKVSPAAESGQQRAVTHHKQFRQMQREHKRAMTAASHQTGTDRSDRCESTASIESPRP